MKPLHLMGLVIAAVLAAAPVRAMEVKVDTQSAKAVLAALGEPGLDQHEAMTVALLPGNQGLVRKAISYHIAATTQAFADALFAAAHGQADTTPTARFLGFDRLKLKAGQLKALVARIEDHPEAFQAWVVDRVATFSPPKSTTVIEGYLIAGGNSGGFAFGEPKFYLNLSYFDEFEPAKLIMAHELYHAVQAVYGVDKDDAWLKPEASTAEGRARQQACANLANLFVNLYEEGSASYVGDPLMLDAATGPLASKTRAEMRDGLDSLGDHITLLELSVVGLQARTPVPYDDVYALDFYLPEPLYKVGYAMAKAIAVDQGQQVLAGFLSQPGYAFALAYAALPKYGRDMDHPKLRPNTIDALHRLAAGCKP